MATNNKECVSLQNLPIAEDQKEVSFVTYDTLGKAIGSLDDLGLCMNWAMLTKVEDHSLVTLLYEGWVYRHSGERFVVLPFDADSQGFESNFKELLVKVFEPFVSFDDIVKRLLISVVPGQNCIKNECFFVTIVFHFSDENGEQAKVIQESLGEVEDGHNSVSGRVFWLD